MVLGDRTCGGILQFLWRREVGEPLPEVDRAVLVRQRVMSRITDSVNDEAFADACSLESFMSEQPILGAIDRQEGSR